MYFELCKRNDKDGNMILVEKNNSQDYMFYANNDNEIIERIRNENPKEITNIFISNIVSNDLLIRIKEIVSVPIYISLENEIEFQDVKYSNQFGDYQKINEIIKKTIELTKYNKYFKECFNNLSDRFKSNEKVINKLVDIKIIEFNNADASFTNYGKIIFESDTSVNNEIIIKDSSVHNSLYFTLEKSFNGPLFEIVSETTKYLISIIPNVQVRNSTHSKIFKLLDENIIKKIVLYCVCHNDFMKNKTLEIEFTQTSLNISFLESEYTNIEKFFEYYMKQKLSYNALYKECNKKQIFISSKRINKNRIKLKILLSKDMQETDEFFDDLDYEIIQFAKNNHNFTRKMIDQTFNISPRNSNMRIKKMLTKNILKSSGISKAIRYNFNDNSEH